MIQRIQTLFLIEIAFLCISLMFIPIEFVISNGVHTPLNLTPVSNALFNSTLGHYAAIAINLLVLLLSVINIFLFKKRELQIKICNIIVILSVILVSMFAFCPFVSLNDNLAIKDSIFGYFIPIIIAISAFFAARYVKKDIDLLKSSDRIR